MYHKHASFRRAFFACLLIGVFLSGCTSSKSVSTKNFKSLGTASYYADKFNGKKTASGEKFSNGKMTTAHKTLPLGTQVKVTNTANGKSVKVKVNDRGPFTKNRELDLSKKAFMKITDNKNHGTLKVRIEIVN